MTKKIPYGLKLMLIEQTGATYHKINAVLSGTSTDVPLIEKVTELLSEYNKKMADLSGEIGKL